jgi:hypothetical protein
MDKQQGLLLVHPVLFSNRVKASSAETLCFPEQTSKTIIVAMVVPTERQEIEQFFRENERLGAPLTTT